MLLARADVFMMSYAFTHAVTSVTVHSVMLRFVQGTMWRRTSGTYTARMMTFLSETKAFQAGELVMITRRPLRFEAHRCQAHLSLVAEGILKYLEAEFPSTTPQVQILVERYSTNSATCSVLSCSRLVAAALQLGAGVRPIVPAAMR